MKKSLTKKAKKVIEDQLERFMRVSSLSEIVRMGAQMMLQSALEEEVTAYLERDYYERLGDKKGTRNGSKPRTVKTSCGVLPLKVPQVRDAGGPF